MNFYTHGSSLKSEYEINFQYSIYFMITKNLILAVLALMFQKIELSMTWVQLGWLHN